MHYLCFVHINILVGYLSSGVICCQQFQLLRIAMMLFQSSEKKNQNIGLTNYKPFVLKSTYTVHFGGNYNLSINQLKKNHK